MVFGSHRNKPKKKEEDIMYLVTNIGEKIELNMDDSAKRAINELLMIASMDVVRGIVDDQGESFTLIPYCEGQIEEEKMEKNIQQGKAPREGMFWRASEWAEFAECYFSNPQVSTKELAEKFKRCESDIKGRRTRLKRRSTSHNFRPTRTKEVLGEKRETGVEVDLSATIPVETFWSSDDI